MTAPSMLGPTLSWREPRRSPRASEAFVAITGLAIALLASLAALGCDHPPTSPAPAPVLVPSPMPAPTSVPPASAPVSSLCITEGDVVPTSDHASVREPATRGFLAGSTGDAATLAFTYRGRSQSVAALASGDTRAQLGLKLRAQDSCNVIYVMWRIEPTSEIVVQTKRNDAHAHRDCGNEGYTRVRPAWRRSPPALGVPEWSAATNGTTFFEHTLAAAIVDDDLEVRADGALVWRGTLPANVRDLRGPVGFRTDNVDVDLVLDAPARGEGTCPTRRTSARDARASGERD